MPKRKPTPIQRGRRPGWGRPIFLELPDDADVLLERARAEVGLDRASFCRVAVLERLRKEVAA